MKSRIIHTIQNTSQLKITHLLVNYAYSVVEWDDFTQVLPQGHTAYDVNLNPSSGQFNPYPQRMYNLNLAKLYVYGLHGNQRELINSFILPYKFSTHTPNVVDGVMTASEIPTPHTPMTLMLRFDRFINYPSIMIEMNTVRRDGNIDNVYDYCDAYFVEVPKLIFDSGVGTTEFNPVIERTQLDNGIYFSTYGTAEDEYQLEPDLPSWDA